jgi:hypothetical protein
MKKKFRLDALPVSLTNRAGGRGGRTNREHYHGNITSCGVQRCGSGCEADSRDCLGDGNVPRAFIELAGAPRDENRDCSSNQVWWAGQS